MEIIKEKTNIDKIVAVLEKGGLVILPTETVYGAMVDATNIYAVKKLNAYKKRPLGKPYSIAILDQKMAEEYVFLNESAKKLYNQFLPGPVTVISKGKGKVAKGVESEIGTVGVRIPDYKLVLDVLKKFKKPITATSANASYQKRPYKISDILENISDKQKNLIDLIVDVGTLPTREPSTVIDTTLDDPAVLRQGDIKLKNEDEVLSRSEENTKNVAKELWQKYERYHGKRAIVFALQGKMGAGKTVFVKGLAKAMGIKDEVTSPSYDLLLTYNQKGSDNKLVHIDTWRMLDADEEIDEIGTEKLISDKTVLAIEWADIVEKEIRKYADDALVIWVKVELGKEENNRLISWGAL